MDAAIGHIPYGALDVQGPTSSYYLEHYGVADAPIMNNPTPSTNPAEFGSYPNYLVARVDGLKATRGMCRTGTIGRSTRTEEDGVGGEESAVIDKTGHFVNLSAVSLREPLTDLWGSTSGRMCEMAAFATNKEDAGAQGLKPKPLSPEARAIVDRPPTPERPQAQAMIASDLSGDLDDEDQAADGGEDNPVEPGSAGGLGSTTPSPYTLGLSRRTAGGGLPVGADDKKGKAVSVKKDSKADVAEQPGGAADAVTTPARRKGVVYLPAHRTAGHAQRCGIIPLQF